MAFTDFLKSMQDDAEKLFGRIKDRDTFRRVVFSAYLIARADGSIDSEEKSALAKLIKRDLPQFTLDDIIAALAKADEKLEFDETIGTMELFDDISGAKGESRNLIMRTAVFIGASDGDFDADEKAVARKLATRMGLRPADYQL